MHKVLMTLLFTSLLTACSSLPETLVSSKKPLVTEYETWVNSEPNAVQEVRLGGVIAKVSNLQHKTRLELVNLPIGKDGKPDINVEPQGRFIAYVDGFIDPLTFAEGRLVTVLGQPNGNETGKVGEFDYRFPVLQVTGYHLWQIREQIIVQDQPMTRFPCRSLYCRNVHYGPSKGHVVQSVE
ncbi:Slp family lipoprotein [Vibrio rarus]|uniref:Slp family lipoprotein n=1 Tax=Vibrio rarus TaxID=413403 RepID=UPI0021C40233|nr:Slp family lipoprotein [Vibrio rarus]